MFTLGLKHIPRPMDISNDEIDKAFFRFKHSLLWKYHFRFEAFLPRDDDLDSSDSFNPKLRPKSNPIPCHYIQTGPIFDLVNDLENDLDNYKRLNPPSYRMSTISKIIKDIQTKYPSVIFKDTDKNLGLCALEIDHYNKLVLDHLLNTNNYQQVGSNSLSTERLKKKLINKFKEFRLSTTWYPEEKKLINHPIDFQFPYFYILPKVHKPGELKGRPITGAVNWITTPVSKILDCRLLVAMNGISSSILKNSEQLVRELELAELDPNQEYHLITGDVQSLYPSINLSLLYKLIDRLDCSLTPLVEFVCNNNYVEYNGRIFKQTNGIAMGTNAAVQLANYYMKITTDSFFENENLSSKLIYYRRFIDDIFIVWRGPLDRWFPIAERMKNNLGLKIEFSEPRQSINFLDVNITIDSKKNKFHTNVHQKILNKYLYITPFSFHTPHVFKGFIKGELTRYARLSSEPYAYHIIKLKLFDRLLQRGFSEKYLKSIFRNHTWASRDNEKHPRIHHLAPFVIPYTLRQNHKTLESIWHKYSDQITELLPHVKPMTVFSKRASIKNLISSSKLSKVHQKLISESERLGRKRAFETTRPDTARAKIARTSLGQF